MIWLILCYLLTIGFLCYAAVVPVWVRLPLFAKIWLFPISLFFFIDIIVRVTIGTILFLEPPTLKTITVTALCDSHCNDAGGYRKWLARNICGVLNMIQPKHCEAML